MNEELKVIISAEISKLKSTIGKAEKEVSSFGEQVKKQSANVDKNIKAMGDAIGKGMKLAGVAIAGAATALIGASAATAEYRAEQAKLQTAFETAGASVEQAKTTYNDLYRVLGDSGVAVEAANHLAKLTTNQQELSQWTTICQGVYATFGDSLPIEGLTEAANETAKTGALTGVLADALNWAGVSEDAFQEKLDKCNTEAEREQLIRETLNGLYTDAAANYEKNNAALLAQNEAQARLQENLAAVGAALQPVHTALTNLAAQALAAIMPYIQSFVDNYLPGFIDLLSQIGEGLKSAFEWATQHKELLAVLATALGVVVAAIGAYNAITAIKNAMDAAQVATLGGLITAKLASAAATMAALAPYILIVAAIAAVIAIIVLCVKNWDKIKETVVKVANIIWTKVKEMAEKVVKWFEEMKEKTIAKVIEIKDNITEKFNAIKQSISDKVNEAKKAVVNKFNEIKSSISSAVSGAYNTVKSFFGNIGSSISGAVSGAYNSVNNTFNNMYSTISSKVSSIFTKVSSVFDNIKGAITSKIEAAKDKVSGIIDSIKGFFDLSGGEFKLPKIKMPHFSITPKGWKIGDLLKGKIPKLGISWYAKGGVFDKPTLFGYGNGAIGGLGEAGAEAVVPLEKNTKWLTRIADMLAERQGNTPIILTVDGKVFAQTTIDSINKLTKQTGKLGLNLS